MRATAPQVLGLGLPILLGVYAGCSGDAFEVSTGSSGAATSSSAGTGGAGGATSSTSSGLGGDGTSSVATATTDAATTSSGVGGMGGGNNGSSGPGAGGDGSAVATSVSTSGAGGAGGGPLGWCATLGQNHEFCADFDGSDLLGPWDDSLFEPGMSGTPNMLFTTSEPVSFEVKCPADDTDAWGVALKDHMTSATHTRVEIDVRHTGAAFAAGDLGKIALFTVEYGGYSVDFGLDATGFQARIHGAVETLLPTPPITPNTWVRVGLDVTYAQNSGNVTVLYGGFAVAQLTIPTVNDPQAVGLALYLGQLRQGPTPPFTVLFDNATWDVD